MKQTTLSFAAPKRPAQVLAPSASNLASSSSASKPAPQAQTQVDVSDQLNNLMASIVGNLCHPLKPMPENASQWDDLCQSKERAKQVTLMGMDSTTAEELFMKYGGHGALATRRSMFNMLFVLKQNPPYNNASFLAHNSHSSLAYDMHIQLPTLSKEKRVGQILEMNVVMHPK